jgi:hypothetical protein
MSGSPKTTFIFSYKKNNDEKYFYYIANFGYLPTNTNHVFNHEHMPILKD